MRHLGHIGQLVVLVGLQQDTVARAYDVPLHMPHGRIAGAQHQRIIALEIVRESEREGERWAVIFKLKLNYSTHSH